MINFILNMMKALKMLTDKLQVSEYKSDAMQCLEKIQ